jgi:hypothetical protein
VRSARPETRDHGAVALLVVLAALAVSGLALVATVRASEVLLDGGRARTAADAVALAGVLHGRAAAERIASDNGAVIVSWRSVAIDTGDPPPVVVTVEVRVGTARASARATNGP